MPEGMPYHLETGPTLGLLEQRLNDATKRELLALRAELLSRKPLEDVLPPAVAALLIPVPAPKGGNASSPLGVRLRQAWLGVRQPLAADGKPPDPASIYDNDDDPAKGKWQFYRGNPEEILRQTFVRAVEVSLGISHDVAPDATPTVRANRWPFILMWKCAQPWLEGWVQWRRRPGVVVVVICTPGDGNHIALDPDLHYNLEPANRLAAAGDGYSHDDPNYAANGSIVITHDRHEYNPSVARTTSASAPITIAAPERAGNGAPLPWFGGKFSGVGPVVAVSPTVRDGGVSGEIR